MEGRDIILTSPEALRKLIEEAVTRIMREKSIKEFRWVTSKEAMDLLGIKSKSTLQRYRDEGRIRFSQPDKRIILYDRVSIEDLIEKHAKEKF